MNTFLEIAERLIASRTILIFPHVHMDGDALGSAAALCRALRTLGKKAHVLIEDEIADNLVFLDGGVCTCVTEDASAAEFADTLLDGEAIDVSLCIDCGSTDRFALRKDIFARGSCKICLDHHLTSQPFCDLNYIDPQAAATGEIVYELLQALEAQSGRKLLDKAAGEALFAAIATDTGNFQYSNTTAKTHRIAADLLESGVDFNAVCIALYQNVRPSRVRLSAAATASMELFADGRAAVTAVTHAMAREASAEMNEADGIVETMRNLSGVEIAVLLKEGNEAGEVRVSMRAKSYGDVAAIAARYGGGGHVKAAGCTLRGMTLEEAKAQMTEEVTRALGGGASDAAGTEIENA